MKRENENSVDCSALRSRVNSPSRWESTIGEKATGMEACSMTLCEST